MNKRKSKKPFKKSGKFEPNNFQDRAEIKEYDKGFKAGEKYPVSKPKVYNDPSWYMKNKSIAQSAATYSYLTPTGAYFPITKLLPQSGDQASTAASVAGVLTLQLQLTPGISEDANSAMNIAAANIYSHVRYKNSGSKNYDAPDYMLYLIAMDSAYCLWNWMKRLYALACSYDPTNYYLPKALIEANYVDFDDITANLADFCAYINATAAKLTAFCVPATMSYILRHSWLFSNVYKDSETQKAQIYMFTPCSVYAYDETTSLHGGKLVPITICGDRTLTNKMKLSDIRRKMDTIIHALSYSEDIGVMSGDTLKAFEGNIVKISPVDPDLRLMPTYSQEVMMQIENANFFELPSSELTGGQLDIVQNPNTNYIYYAPELNLSSTAPRSDYMLNMHKQDVTVEDNMVASRLMTTLEFKNNKYFITSVGSEFVTKVTVFYFAPQGATITSKVTSTKSFVLHECNIRNSLAIMKQEDPAAAAAHNIDAVQQIALVNQFDWHPFIPLVHVENGVTNAGRLIFGFMGDIDNYAIISQSNVSVMHQVALLSMFDVPQGSNF